MRFIHRILPLLLLIAVLMSACAVPAAPAQSGATTEESAAAETIASAADTAAADVAAPELVIAVQGLPPTLEPLRENSNVFMRFVYNVFDTLIEFDANTFELKPGLAESWERIDDSTLELKLRQGVKFHNGVDFTAEDVVFSFGPERMFNEEFPGYGNANMFFGTFASVEAVDEYTVRFVSTQPDPLMEQRLTVNTAGIISKQAFETAANYDEFSRLGIGTGPYMISEFVVDDKAVLVPFADYWGGGEHDFSQITFQIVPEVAARVAGLIAGDYGIITEVPPDQFETINNNEGTSVVGGPIRNIRVIIYDKNKSDVMNPTLRRAMNYAIDRQLIVDTLYEGNTEVPQSMQFPYYGEMLLEDWEPQAYDLEVAKELVAESGYNGETLIYRLLPNYYTYQIETAEVMQQMWKEAGINVELEVVENWSQVTDTDIWDVSTTMMYPDPVGHLSRLYAANGLVPNSGSWSNEEFDAEAQNLLSSTDIEARRAAFRRMLEIYQNEDPAGTYLHYLTMFYGKSDAISWEPTVYEHIDLRPNNVEVRQ